MGYLLILIISLTGGLSKIAAKKYSSTTVGINSSVHIYVLMSGIMGLAYYFITSGGNIMPNMPTFIYSLIFALIVIISNAIDILALRKADIVSTAIFIGAGSIVIPILFGAVFLKEHISFPKILAVIILLAMVLMPFFKKHGIKKNNLSGYILCLLLFIINGVVTIIYKLYAGNPNVLSEAVFCFWTNIMIIPFILFIAIKTNSKKQFVSDITALDKRMYLIMLVPSILGNTSTLLSIVALKKVDIVTYTILNTSLNMIITAVLSRIFYNEKITAENCIKIILSIAAVILNNI